MKKTEELVQDVLEALNAMNGVKSDDIPDIGLYMDQVTSLVEKELAREKRYQDDKVLTKTMINNYTKNHLLPPPDKKKYSRDHVVIMILIYYYKSILSFRDIEQLFEPLTEYHFGTTSDVPLSDIYDRLFALAKEQTDSSKEDIRKKMETAKTAFEDCDTEDGEYLKMFTLISELFADIYLKEKVIEYLIDNLAEENERADSASKKKK